MTKGRGALHWNGCEVRTWWLTVGGPLVGRWRMGSERDSSRNSDIVFFFISCILIPCENLALTLPTTQPDHWPFAETLSVESVVSSRDEEQGCRVLVNWLLSNSNSQIYFTFKRVVPAVTDIISEHLSDHRQLPLEIQIYPYTTFSRNTQVLTNTCNRDLL